MPTVVVNTRKHGLTSSNGVELKPGPNELTDEQCKALNECPQIEQWKKQAWVVVQAPTAPPAEAHAPPAHPPAEAPTQAAHGRHTAHAAADLPEPEAEHDKSRRGHR